MAALLVLSSERELSLLCEAPIICNVVMYFLSLEWYKLNSILKRLRKESLHFLSSVVHVRNAT